MVINIRVLTPDRVICTTSADEVILPGLNGLVGVLEGHATMITMLETGLLRIKLNDIWTPIILSDGVAEIDRNWVTVLVNSVEEFSNIDLDLRDAAQELSDAISKLEQAKDDKARLDAYNNLKRVRARTEGIKYLSKKTA